MSACHAQSEVGPTVTVSKSGQGFVYTGFVGVCAPSRSTLGSCGCAHLETGRENVNFPTVNDSFLTQTLALHTSPRVGRALGGLL